ncbi:hypothetical protein Tco_1486940, partial [Tanacetum coccineum]
VLFGLCLIFYLPTLDPYPGYTPISEESLDDAEYEPLADGEQICPERRTNIISSIFFSWMDPLMFLGYKRPLTEKDIWKLDDWDTTETLNSRHVIVSAYIFIFLSNMIYLSSIRITSSLFRFQMYWQEEVRKPKPWLLRALHRSLGGRFV